MTKFNENFWNWFGDSFVVDNDGKPQIVYHGTYYSWGELAGRNFSEFDIEASDLGAHFSVSPALASDCSKFDYAEYSSKEYKECRVYPVYLSIQNPAKLPDMGQWREPYYWKTALKDHPRNKLLQHMAREFAHDNFDIKAELIRMGFDGIVYRNDYEDVKPDDDSTCYIAFHPYQIKSVHNSGAWSPRTGNIMNPPLRSGWKRGVIGDYVDRGYIYGRWALARLHTESCRPSKDSWNVFYDGKPVDTYRDTLSNLMRHVESLRR